jgi:hypothetical protein
MPKEKLSPGGEVIAACSAAVVADQVGIILMLSEKPGVLFARKSPGIE